MERKKKYLIEIMTSAAKYGTKTNQRAWVNRLKWKSTSPLLRAPYIIIIALITFYNFYSSVFEWIEKRIIWKNMDNTRGEKNSYRLWLALVEAWTKFRVSHLSMVLSPEGFVFRLFPRKMLNWGVCSMIITWEEHFRVKMKHNLKVSSFSPFLARRWSRYFDFRNFDQNKVYMDWNEMECSK